MLLLLMPLFARELEEKGSLREFVGRSLVPITAALLLCTVTIMLTAPWLVEALAPGLAMPELATRSVRTTALTVVFLGLCGYVMAALGLGMSSASPPPCTRPTTSASSVPSSACKGALASTAPPWASPSAAP